MTFINKNSKSHYFHFFLALVRLKGPIILRLFIFHPVIQQSFVKWMNSKHCRSKTAHLALCLELSVKIVSCTIPPRVWMGQSQGDPELGGTQVQRYQWGSSLFCDITKGWFLKLQKEIRTPLISAKTIDRAQKHAAVKKTKHRTLCNCDFLISTIIMYKSHGNVDQFALLLSQIVLIVPSSWLLTCLTCACLLFWRIVDSMFVHTYPYRP